MGTLEVALLTVNYTQTQHKELPGLRGSPAACTKSSSTLNGMHQNVTTQGILVGIWNYGETLSVSPVTSK